MALQVGDKCPSFSLPDQHGNTIAINDFIGKMPLVVYFYPKDHTGGCTAEACSFRDSHQDFKELGAEVIGISSDSIDSHERFATEHRLNFILLADTEKKVRKQFGVPRNMFGLIAGRVTYIIDKQGTIREIFNSLNNTDGHIQTALATLKKLNEE